MSALASVADDRLAIVGTSGSGKLKKSRRHMSELSNRRPELTREERAALSLAWNGVWAALKVVEAAFGARVYGSCDGCCCILLEGDMGHEMPHANDLYCTACVPTLGEFADALDARAKDLGLIRYERIKKGLKDILNAGALPTDKIPLGVL
jgi:hypothetical protein